MMRSISPLFVIAALAGLLAVNALVLAELQDIGTSLPGPAAPPESRPVSDRPVIRIGVVSRFAPNLIYAGYQPVMDYLNRHGAYHYELRLSTSYQDAVDRLTQGEVTASFLGAWITSGLDPEGDLRPLLAPLNGQGQSEFRAVLVTGPGSSLDRLEQLKGARVALPSAQSWSGIWLGNTGLPAVGLAPADLDSIHHFDHHQTVVWQVLRGNFDAGVVKESVAARYRREGLREVTRSEPIPGPPLVGNRRAAAAALEEIQRLLLALDPADPADRRVLTAWTPEFSNGFTPVTMDSYVRAFAGRQGAP